MNGTYAIYILCFYGLIILRRIFCILFHTISIVRTILLCAYCILLLLKRRFSLTSHITLRMNGYEGQKQKVCNSHNAGQSLEALNLYYWCVERVLVKSYFSTWLVALSDWLFSASNRSKVYLVIISAFPFRHISNRSFMKGYR